MSKKIATRSLRSRTARFRSSVRGHVWTAPTGQGILLAFCLRSGASHVSGLFARHHDRWP